MTLKTLKFNHIEAENIKQGVQTATLRMKDEKHISVNDEVQIIDKIHESDPKSWRVIGTAIVDQVRVLRAGELKLDGADFEQFGSLAELYKQLEVFYGDPIEDSAPIKVISFTFKEFTKEQPLESVDDENTTQVTEVKLYGDGGSRGNPGPSASGFVLLDMNDTILETNGEYLNITTNNQAEYHSLKLGLERALQMGVKIIHVYMDSMLVVMQMRGLWKVRNEELKVVYQNVKHLADKFEQIDFNHVPREKNKLADAEVNRILDSVAE